MLALASLYWLIQKLGSFFCTWRQRGVKKIKGEGVRFCPGPPPLQKRPPYTPHLRHKAQNVLLGGFLGSPRPPLEIELGGVRQGDGGDLQVPARSNGVNPCVSVWGGGSQKVSRCVPCPVISP